MEFTREDFNAILNEGSTESVEETSTEVGVKELCMDNVVSKDKLRNVQGKTLNKLAEYIQATYGPLGSNTMIVSGNNKQTILSNYSKDGLKVLKHIIFSEPLEMAIKSEIENIARFVERKVGDGTTSSIILSSEIFNGLSKIEKEFRIPPRKLIKLFDHCVKDLQEEISSRGREITLEDIYKICMISTNGNESISKVIENLYMQFGFDVQIDVGISNDKDSKLKIYDGLTVNEG
jgi:chaperonin GroEL (HSP60 family)